MLQPLLYHHALGMNSLNPIPLLLGRFGVANKCIGTSSYDHLVLTLLARIFYESDGVTDESAQGLARVAESSATGTALYVYPPADSDVCSCHIHSQPM